MLVVRSLAATIAVMPCFFILTMPELEWLRRAGYLALLVPLFPAMILHWPNHT